jgi:hypothetical protein
MLYGTVEEFCDLCLDPGNRLKGLSRVMDLAFKDMHGRLHWGTRPTSGGLCCTGTVRYCGRLSNHEISVGHFSFLNLDPNFQSGFVSRSADPIETGSNMDPRHRKNRRYLIF